MPSARAIKTMATALMGLLAAACADVAERQAEYTRMPRAVRIGAAEIAIERVEQNVSRGEVREAVRRLVEQARVCFSWPGVWLQQEDRRNVFTVRYGLMARDWGGDVATASALRMQEFVDMGFLTKRDRLDLGDGAVEYTLTSAGNDYLEGTPYGGDLRPSFCAPAERRLVELVDLEWGQFPCGNLHVRFTHVADDWPRWARTDGARARIAETWGPNGLVSQGDVSLSRQWYRPSRIPADVQRNGELRSACYDEQRARIIGDDLNLTAAAPGPQIQ